MTIRIEAEKLKNATIYLLLFLAAMNFRAKFFYFVFASLVLMMLFQKRLLINRTCLVYIALGLLMAAYNHREGVLSMIRVLAFASLYVVGYNIMTMPLRGNEVRSDTWHSVEKTGLILLATISAGSFTHYLLNYLNNFGSSIGRNTKDIWSGAIMAATGQATLACLMLGLSVAMVFMPLKKKYRYIGVLCIVLAMAYNLTLAGRTMLVILALLVLLALLYIRRTLHNPSQRAKQGIGFLAAAMVLLIVFANDLGGIQSILLDSQLFERFREFSFNTNRLYQKSMYIRNMFRYPFGGMHMRAQYSYAHDLLLDGYDEYGILGFMLLLSILILGIRALLRVLRNNNFSQSFKLAMLCVYASVLLVFCVEPILAGMAWLFACYSLINGCLDGINRISAGH